MIPVHDSSIDDNKQRDFVLSDHANDQAIRNLCVQIADLGIISESLDHHRIESVVYRRLKGITGSGVPDPVLTELRNYSAQQTRKILSMTAELVRLVTIFDQKNIPVLSLKGPLLAMQLYGDIGLRPSNTRDSARDTESFLPLYCFIK